MIIREYKDTDSENKFRVFAEIKCDNCDSVYIRQKRFLKETHGCSPKCLSSLKGTRVIVKCAHCNAEVEKSKSKLDNSKSGLYFCNRKCKEAAQTYIIEIMPDHYYTGSGIYGYRKKAFDHYGKQCNNCGYNDNEKALDVHHRDKNRDNNDIENLEVLCCNCHAIVHRGI